MDYDIDEYLEEYDDFTNNVMSAGINLFHSRLEQWFHLLDSGDGDIAGHIKWLESRTKNGTVVPSSVFIKDGTNAGSGKIKLPADRNDRLASYLYLFRRLVSEPKYLYELGFTTFYDKNTSVSLMKITSEMFEPFAKELRRYIQRNFDEPVPEETNEKVEVPASDRIVHLNHNEPELLEITALLQSIELDIRGLNDIDVEIQDRALAELRAANEILKAQTARFELLKTLLFDGLKWLAIKFADNVAGTAILALISLVAAFFGFT